jgi:hypothetical protein
MKPATEPKLSDRPSYIIASGQQYLDLIPQIEAGGERIFAVNVVGNATYELHLIWPSPKTIELSLGEDARPKGCPESNGCR